MVALTRREQDVIRALRVHRARSLKAIGVRLHVSTRTAEAFVTSISRKLPADFEEGARPFIRVLLWALRPS